MTGGDDGGMLALLLVAWVFCACLGWLVGNFRGRGAAGAILGFLLGPLGVLIAALLPQSAEIEAARDRRLAVEIARASAESPRSADGPGPADKDVTDRAEAVEEALRRQPELRAARTPEDLGALARLVESIERELRVAHELEAAKAQESRDREVLERIADRQRKMYAAAAAPLQWELPKGDAARPEKRPGMRGVTRRTWKRAPRRRGLLAAIVAVASLGAILLYSLADSRQELEKQVPPPSGSASMAAPSASSPDPRSTQWSDAEAAKLALSDIFNGSSTTDAERDHYCLVWSLGYAWGYDRLARMAELAGTLVSPAAYEDFFADECDGDVAKS